jgi:nicotinamide-nucleotide amidase
MTLVEEAAALLALCRERGWRLATAESCTGGLIAATLTAVAGSSDVVDRGFVTYSNAAKTEMLGVAAQIVAAHGAVSEQVARAMAAGALARSAATAVVACTGIAGPSGGSLEKPVGLVYVACAVGGGRPVVERHVFPGDRDAVREATVRAAFRMLRAWG